MRRRGTTFRQRIDTVVAGSLIVTGLTMSGIAALMFADDTGAPASRAAQRSPQQVSQPLSQQTPSPAAPSSPAPQTTPPAESKPGGTRPTTPAPEPARPDSEAQKEGVKPALPPAPAEKIAPPIRQ